MLRAWTTLIALFHDLLLQLLCLSGEVCVYLCICAAVSPPWGHSQEPWCSYSPLYDEWNNRILQSVHTHAHTNIHKNRITESYNACFASYTCKHTCTQSMHVTNMHIFVIMLRDVSACLFEFWLYGGCTALKENVEECGAENLNEFLWIYADKRTR